MSEDSESKNKHLFFWNTALLWILVLGGILSIRLFGSPSQQNYQIGWMSQLPLYWLSLIVSLFVLRQIWHRDNALLVKSYDIVDQMRSIRRITLYSFHILPLIGAISSSLFFASYLAQKNQSILLTVICLALTFSIHAFFFWKTKGKYFSLLALFLAGSLFAYGKTKQIDFPSTPELLQLFLFSFFTGSIIIIYLALSLRWFQSLQSHRASLQKSLLLLVFLVLSGCLLSLLWPDSKQLSKHIGVLMLLIFGFSLLILSIKSLWEGYKLSQEHEFLSLYRLNEYIALSSLPLANGLALFGWLYLGGELFQSNPQILTYLAASHLLGVISMIFLGEIHKTHWRYRNRIWVFAQAFLLYLTVFLPFGFSGLAIINRLQ